MRYEEQGVVGSEGIRDGRERRGWNDPVSIASEKEKKGVRTRNANERMAQHHQQANDDGEKEEAQDVLVLLCAIVGVIVAVFVKLFGDEAQFDAGYREDRACGEVGRG